MSINNPLTGASPRVVPYLPDFSIAVRVLKWGVYSTAPTTPAAPPFPCRTRQAILTACARPGVCPGESRGQLHCSVLWNAMHVGVGE